MIEMGVKAAMHNNIAGGQVQAAGEACLLIAAAKHDGDIAAPMVVARDALVRAQLLAAEIRRMKV